MGAVYGVLRALRRLAQDYEQEQERRFNKAYTSTHRMNHRREGR